MNRLLLIVSFVLVFSNSGSAWADEALNRARDLEAASPRDVTRPPDIPGVAFDDVDSVKAIAACKLASDSDPENRRIGFQYGRALEIGGTPESEALAVLVYQKASDQGHVLAANNLGNMYREGRGTAVDFVKAFQLYEKSARALFPFAMTSLGYADLEGRGTDKDEEKGQEWIVKSADLGDDEANREAGLNYVMGRGTPVNLVKAFYYSARASDLGNKNAKNDLALFLLEGPEAFRDVEWGRKVILESADLGSGMAMMNIATHTFNGTAFPKDEAGGVAWLVKALQVNDEIPDFLIKDRAKSSTDAVLDKTIEAMLKWKGLMKSEPDGKFDDETVAALVVLKSGE